MYRTIPTFRYLLQDYRTAVCPFIDVVDYNNMEYRAQDEGARGAFDWQLYYKRQVKSQLNGLSHEFMKSKYLQICIFFEILWKKKKVQVTEPIQGPLRPRGLFVETPMIFPYYLLKPHSSLPSIYTYQSRVIFISVMDPDPAGSVTV